MRKRPIRRYSSFSDCPGFCCLFPASLPTWTSLPARRSPRQYYEWKKWPTRLRTGLREAASTEVVASGHDWRDTPAHGSHGCRPPAPRAPSRSSLVAVRRRLIPVEQPCDQLGRRRARALPAGRPVDVQAGGFAGSGRALSSGGSHPVSEGTPQHPRPCRPCRLRTAETCSLAWFFAA